LTLRIQLEMRLPARWRRGRFAAPSCAVDRCPSLVVIASMSALKKAKRVLSSIIPSHLWQGSIQYPQ
jgi:hypothetical protein